MLIEHDSIVARRPDHRECDHPQIRTEDDLQNHQVFIRCAECDTILQSLTYAQLRALTPAWGQR